VRFKLDENLPYELTVLFLRARHDASTVLEQGLGGSRDSDLIAVCTREDRTMVTFDKDFTDIRTYPPAKHAGIVVFRLESQARDHVLEVAGRFLSSLPEASISGQLWIVEESRIRVRR
jgi:predicted nuclease of predicted toxin-antitoxin system